jgi:polypeptide N-acetylgalactosaminyltransferase
MSDHPKVKIIRTKMRAGLMKARIMGTQAAQAPILTFLDSHVECAEGWLEPLLIRIAQKPTIVAVPVIDTIDEDTFEYQWIKDPNAIPIGGFDWRLSFKWITTFEKRGDPTFPIRTPTMSGGLFAIDKNFFYRLGMYDAELEIWGVCGIAITKRLFNKTH